MCRQYNLTALLNAEAFGVYTDVITVQYGKDKTCDTGGKKQQKCDVKKTRIIRMLILSCPR